MIKPLHSLLSFLSLVAAGASLTASPIVLNGGFEATDVSNAPYIAGYLSGSDIAGWHVDYSTYDTNVIHDNFTAGGVTWANPVEGSQFLYLGNSISAARISQQVQLEGGHSYDFSYWLADFDHDGGNHFGAGAWVTADLVSTTTNDSLFGGPATRWFQYVNGFQQVVLSFDVAATGSYTLSFTSIDGWAANLDDVRIVDTTNGSPVPDSGVTAILLAGACAGLVAVRRRK